MIPQIYIPLPFFLSWGGGGGGVLQYVLIDMICLSIGPPFEKNTYIHDPFFTTVQMTPCFQNLKVKFQILCALSLCMNFKNFVNFQLMANFHSNFAKFTPNNPLLWEIFFGLHTKWPLFSTKFYTEFPVFVLR